MFNSRFTVYPSYHIVGVAVLNLLHV